MRALAVPHLLMRPNHARPHGAFCHPTIGDSENQADASPSPRLRRLMFGARIFERKAALFGVIVILAGDKPAL